MSDTKPSTVNFAQLIGPPALLPGEDAAQYEALRAAVRKRLEPQDVLAEADANDITDKIWEAQRYRKLQVHAMEGARISALAHLLRPIFDLQSSISFEFASDYFSDHPERSFGVRNLMTVHGITDEMIYARAFGHECGKISYLDRMINNRETSRNGLLREHERRQRRAAKQSRKRGANDNETSAKKTATP